MSAQYYAIFTGTTMARVAQVWYLTERTQKLNCTLLYAQQAVQQSFLSDLRKEIIKVVLFNCVSAFIFYK